LHQVEFFGGNVDLACRLGKREEVEEIDIGNVILGPLRGVEKCSYQS